MSITTEQKAKIWCLENEYTIKQMESFWNNALESDNFIIKNLSSHGKTWMDLPTHLLKQLAERYQNKVE